jgi:hypothetical protein
MYLIKNINFLKCFIFLIIIIIPIYGLDYTYHDFQDPSIIWEGVYRLYKGQKPFIDFGIPFGTGVFILPYLVSKILGFSMHSLYLSSYILNLIYLLTFYSFFRLLKLNYVQIILSFFFIGIWVSSKMPWYNASAYIYSIISIYFSYRYIILKKNYYLIFLSGFFCSLSIFTKQDFGLLCLAYQICIFIFNYKTLSKKEFLLIFISYLTIISLPFIYYIKSDIWYWFNFIINSKPGQVDVLTIERTIFEHKKFSIFLFFYICSLGIILYLISKFKFLNLNKKEKFFYGLIGFIFFQKIICGYLSGSGPDAVRDFISITIPLILIFNYKKILNLTYKKKIVLLITFLFISTNLMIPPNKGVDQFLLSNQITNIKKYSLIGNLNILKSFIFIKKNDLDFFNFNNFEKKSFDKLLNYSLKKRFNCNFLNLGENVYLYQKFNTEPCPDHPLYYTVGTAIFDKELNLLKERIEKNYYGSILYQDLWGEGSNIILKKYLDAHYNLVLVIKHSKQSKYNLYLYEAI